MKLIKKLPLILLLPAWLFAGLAHADSAASNYQVTLVSDNFPPYNMAKGGKTYASETEMHGLAVDVLRETFKRAGVEYSMSLRSPWLRVFKMAMDSPAHGVFVTAKVPTREKLFKWVGPIFQDDWVLLAPVGSGIRLSSLADASDYRIGVQQGNLLEERLSKEGLQTVKSQNDQENLRKLNNGQIDLWATSAATARYLTNQSGPELEKLLRIDSTELYLALNGETPDEVAARLQKALDSLKSDGTLSQITQRY